MRIGWPRWLSGRSALRRISIVCFVLAWQAASVLNARVDPGLVKPN